MAERHHPRTDRQPTRRYWTRSSKNPASAQGSSLEAHHDPRVDNNNPESAEDDSSTSSAEHLLAHLRRDFISSDGARREHSLTPDSVVSMSRVRSFQNLTTSSLAGIYAAVDDKDILDTDSPWDTGPERPVRRDPHMDEPLYMLLRDRCYPPARRRVYSISHQPGARRPVLTVAIPRFLARRGALLFFLGMGFAILITYFHKDQRHWSITLGYLAFWGTVGMAIGGLQPLFDGLWNTVFPEELEKRDDESKRVEEPKPTQEMRLSTHWDAAMRAVGTVMGIVYAFRHLIWTSSIQFSVALAVINPIFWWAVDRSKTGFIFSASAALLGSLFLLGSDLKVVPSPPTISTAILRNATTNGVDFYLTLGGRTSLEAAEETIWMLSVLFCSSVCFGNVGRVLAADHSERVVPWDPMVKVKDL